MASPLASLARIARRAAGADASTLDSAPAAEPLAANPADPRGLGAASGVTIHSSLEQLPGVQENVRDVERQRQLSRRLWAIAGDIRDRGTSADPILNLIRRLPGMGSERGLKLQVYESLRETLPVLNAAILKRRFIEGDLVIEARDPGLQTALREFQDRVPVQNYAQAEFLTGLDTWLDFASENADTLGMGIAEVVTDGGTVERLQAPHPGTFYWKESEVQTGDGETRRRRKVWKLYQRRQDGEDQEIDSPFVKLLTFSNNPGGPGGRPVAWGLSFVSEILIRILVSMNNSWHRVGDPSYLHQITYSQRQDGSYPSTKEVDGDVLLLDELLASGYAARSAGRTMDVIMGLADGKIESEPLGGNPLAASLAGVLQPHYQTVAGQVIANADVPAWMFPAGVIPAEGLNSNRSEIDARMCLAAGETRNVRRAGLARFACDQFLILDGSPRGLGRYTLRFAQPSLSDPKTEAETRAARENANATAIDNALLLADAGIARDDEERDAYLIEAGVIRPRE